jgi:hypothetical protein
MTARIADAGCGSDIGRRAASVVSFLCGGLGVGW